MKNIWRKELMFKRITAFLLASVMILSSIIQVHAEEIEINFIQNI